MQNSYFKILLKDGREITEKDIKWSEISERQIVDHFGHQRMVHVCKEAVARIEAFFDGLQSAIDVPDGCQVYQSMRSETVIVPGVQRIDRVIGRLIGVVKDGIVLEERFLNGLSYSIEGSKK